MVTMINHSKPNIAIEYLHGYVSLPVYQRVYIYMCVCVFVWQIGMKGRNIVICGDLVALTPLFVWCNLKLYHGLSWFCSWFIMVYLRMGHTKTQS